MSFRRRIIKVFGERNTGTRALKQMLSSARYVSQAMPSPCAKRGNIYWAKLQSAIDRHYTAEWRRLYNDALRDSSFSNATTLNLWKHAAPVCDETCHKSDACFIILVRNPYSWVLSMARRPYHMKGPRTSDFDVFLRRPWLTEKRENCEIVLPSVMGLWQEKLTAYVDFAAKLNHKQPLVTFVQFEKLIENPTDAVTNALAKFRVSPKGVHTITRSTKDHDQTLANLQNYYAKETWKNRLSAGNVEFINQFIDWDVARSFGYTPLDPRDFPAHINANEKTRFQQDMLSLDMCAEFSLDREAGATATA